VVAPKQQQQDGELRCFSCILVFNVLFEYENPFLLFYCTTQSNRCQNSASK
jgi:hypothetical protein